MLEAIAGEQQRRPQRRDPALIAEGAVQEARETVAEESLLIARKRDRLGREPGSTETLGDERELRRLSRSIDSFERHQHRSISGSEHSAASRPRSARCAIVAA